MNRTEALSRLASTDDLSYDDVDDIFAAFGFTSDSPSFSTEVYYHARYKRCGAFTARDDGLNLVLLTQRSIIRRMLECVLWHEQLGVTDNSAGD